jgi:hypothetical protein
MPGRETAAGGIAPPVAVKTLPVSIRLSPNAYNPLKLAAKLRWGMRLPARANPTIKNIFFMRKGSPWGPDVHSGMSDM